MDRITIELDTNGYVFQVDNASLRITGRDRASDADLRKIYLALGLYLNSKRILPHYTGAGTVTGPSHPGIAPHRCCKNLGCPTKEYYGRLGSDEDSEAAHPGGDPEPLEHQDPALEGGQADTGSAEGDPGHPGELT